jgi:hypothetical protein
MTDESVTLKHFEDAIAGRRLSGTMAYEINEAIGSDYEGGDKLEQPYKNKLAKVALAMIQRGVMPAKSLLTEHQKLAIEMRRAKA